jgi:hypothetical protein
MEQMLRFIEETIPVKSIFIKESENGTIKQNLSKVLMRYNNNYKDNLQ